MRNAFLIEAYMKENGVIQGNCVGVRNYLDRNNILINQNEMLLMGRALIDFDVKDILLTSQNSKIFIYKFHLYGHELNFISEGCTCVIFCSIVPDAFGTGDIIRIL